MDYNKTLKWLFSQLPMFSRIGAPAYKPGLQTTETLDELYSHPHRKYKTIHVAGTNGKGSTSHMIAAVLQAAGYKTGLYTSPHLTDFRERMRINGKMIPKKKVTEFVERWEILRQQQHLLTLNLKPSFFELTMMMAFDWFASEKVNVAVIEVGMGGRLDSTNIIYPEVGVITNISFDHTQFLGDTLEAIAAEKAGIIKHEVPIVVGEAEGAIRKIFEDKAHETGASIHFAQDNPDKIYIEEAAHGWSVNIPGYGTFTVPLEGEYQRHNILTVLTALAEMHKKGFNFRWEEVKTGFENVSTLTGLRGRWQIIQESPMVICDTGHNLAGISENLKTLSCRYSGKKIRFIIGFVNDKDVSHIVKLFPKTAEYCFVQASVPRAMPAGKVAEYFAGQGITGKVIPDIYDAYEEMKRNATPDEIIYVGGSTFVVADFLAKK